jgi:hypothetical protein
MLIQVFGLLFLGSAASFSVFAQQAPLLHGDQTKPPRTEEAPVNMPPAELTAAEMEKKLEVAEQYLFNSLFETSMTWSPRVHEIRQNKDKLVRFQGAPSGLVDQVAFLESALGLDSTGGDVKSIALGPRLSALKKALGMDEQPNEGTILALRRCLDAYSKRLDEEMRKERDVQTDLSAEEFDRRYGNPAKLSLEDRAIKAALFLDAMDVEKRTKEAKGLIPSDRIRSFQAVVPESASKFGTDERRLSQMEDYFSLKQEPKDTLETRMNRLSPLIEKKYAELLKEKRSAQTLSEKVQEISARAK